MGDKKESSIGFFPSGYLFVQTTVLVVHYGVGWKLPWWVLWFPTFVTIPLMAVVFVLLLISAWVASQ